MATAETSIDSGDARLVGRTYGIPFAQVWDSCLDLVRGELPHWYARWWDEEVAVIQALRSRAYSRRVSDVAIRIRLDEEGQTRVDVRASSRFTAVGDFGSNTRLIGAFCAALDRKLTEPPPPPALIADVEPIPAEAGEPTALEAGEVPAHGAASEETASASDRNASEDSASGG